MDQDEKLLIKQAKKGDEGSFEALILSCKGKAYNIALRYMKNEQDAMDALQESFIKIFRHLDQFNESSKFDTWVYRIVVNTCNDQLRKNAKRNKEDSLYYEDSEDGETSLELAGNDLTPEEEILAKELQSEILKCLEQLSSEHKEVLILRDMQGFSYEEVAKLTGCSVGTVKSRLSRARGKLKEIYLEMRNKKDSKTV